MNERTGRFALASLAAFFGAVLILLGAGACEAVRREKTVALTFDDGPHGEKFVNMQAQQSAGDELPPFVYGCAGLGFQQGK